MQFSESRAPLIGGVIAAITASLCCVGPLVLLALGVSGAWIAQLTALEPVRPLFIGITLLLFGIAFHRLYSAPRVCEPGRVCADPVVKKRQRFLFWMAAVLVALLLVVPLFAPLFY